MSPQGKQAQAAFTALRRYNPNKDDRHKSGYRYLKRRASSFTASGALPESDRRELKTQFNDFWF